MPTIIVLIVGVFFVAIGIGYWIGTLPQRVAAAETRTEIARYREARKILESDPDYEDTADWG